jgi:catalase-peroxidase
MGFTSRTETLTDFFVNLLDLRTTWKAVSESDDAFVVVIEWLED